MAEYALIDGYLDTFRTTVRSRRDLDDLVAEVQDHLYSAAEQAESHGTDRVLAQRRTLERFGDPELLATAFASTSDGGIAMPTHFTRTAGLAGMLSAFLILGLPLAWTLAVISERRSGAWDGLEVAIWMVGAPAFLASIALLVMLAVGLDRRHGGLGTVRTVSLVLLAMGGVASLVAWFIFGWGVLLGAGMLSLAVALLQRKHAPRWATVAFGGGMFFGLAVFVVLRYLEVGWRDSWGDYPLATALGVWAMCGATAVGLYGLGRWLRSEEPVDVEGQPTAVA